jgi:hypothetical protein
MKSWKLLGYFPCLLLEHIFHLLNINLSPKYSRDRSHDSNGPILTNFDQVSHIDTPSLYLRGDLILLSSEGTFPTFSLILGSYSIFLGFYFLCLSSWSDSRNLIPWIKEGKHFTLLFLAISYFTWFIHRLDHFWGKLNHQLSSWGGYDLVNTFLRDCMDN